MDSDDYVYTIARADADSRPRWTHLCEGLKCERRDGCRRYLYHTMKEFVMDDSLRHRMNGETATNKCRLSLQVEPKTYHGYIALDSADWNPAPTFWRLNST